MSRLRDLALNDEGFVFDPRTGNSYLLNPSGLVILHGLRGGKNGEQVAEALSRRYALSLEDAVRDVIDFILHLRSIQLV